MKKTTNLLVAFLAIMFVVSCSAPKQKEGEDAEETQSTQGTEVAEPEVDSMIHINLATVEELSSVQGISVELAGQIAEMRPFFTMTRLDSLLGSKLSDEQKAGIYNRLFVKLNLNTATEEEFKMIPGVGDKMAHEFEEYRPYVSIEQFRREIGKYVDEDEVARYERYVFVPINLNTATDEEILSIPGVGNRMLHEFREYRPYNSIEQFRREIGKYVDDQELVRLERFVTL